MICSNCGAENEAGRKFCGECGTRLAVICPNCGAQNAATAKFCGQCATPLAAGPAAAASAPLTQAATPARAAPAVAQRRVVSVLFADLVGFTPFAEERDAEDVRDTLTRYFEIATDVITRYGGTIEKFIGDAVMAVWGAPTAREDDAERAVRASLDLVDAVKTLGPSIQARAGVLTGEAAVTIGATNQGMVAGDLVNTAARLQAVAAPGTVLVGEATQRLASKAIFFEAVGEQALKGKVSPVPAWRAVRVVAEVGGRGRADTLEAPFVGRDDELRLLKDLFHATAREGRARLVSVIGPAGIGKTRLAWEFSKYLDGVVDTVWWHDGRSPAYGEGISFWALGEMVRERCRLLETDDEATTRAKVAATLVEHVPDAEERQWIEPALLALLGIGASVVADQLFGAWRTFFERLAATAPVAMVFEDHHFADSGLLDFVDHLLEWSRNVPIYVVTLSRPELLERRPDFGAGKRNFTSLYLEPLTASAMRELLSGLVPGLPDAAIQALVARADGIPLYAVETVRMLLADGQLALEGGTYHPVGDLSALSVPETLTALIASRLDGLAPDDRALVSDAAVLGQSFTIAALAAVSGIAEAELEPRLLGIVRRELLTLKADARSPERGQYGFVQALIREVAYNTLAHADRKSRHIAAARFFEGLGSDELAGALAGHYLAAHENAPAGPEADALAAQARIALVAAAQRAVALGSHDQATIFYRQALTVTTDPVEEADLLERAGEAASAAAHHDQAEALLRRALALQRERGDRPAIARATAALGSALLATFRNEPALALLEPAAEEFADLDTEPGFVAILGQLARAYFLYEEPDRAIEVVDRALAAAERADLVALVADAMITRGSTLSNLGRRYEGLAVIDGGLRLAERHRLLRTVLRGRINLGAMQADGDPRGAFETARVGLAEAKRLGHRRPVLLFLTNGAEVAMLTGEWDWALPEMEELVAGDYEAQDRLLLLGELIWIRSWRGVKVDELVEEVERIARDLQDPSYLFVAASARAFRAFGLGDLEEAAAIFRQAATLTAGNAPTSYVFGARAALRSRDATSATTDLAALVATGVHGQPIDARIAEIEAGIAALEGRDADARARYRDALNGFRDLGLPVEAALTAIEMATLMDPADPDVRAAADAARDVFAQLGGIPFLAQLDAAMTRSSEATVGTARRSEAPIRP